MNGDNMRKWQLRFCSLILLASALGACASQPPVGDVKVLVRVDQVAWKGANEYSAASAKKHNVGIRIWEANFDNGAADCTIWVKNNGSRPIRLGTENIRLEGMHGALPILGKAEMIAQLNKEIEQKSIGSSLTGIAEVLAASNKGTSTHTGTFEGDTEYGPVQGTYAGTSHDPNAAAAARETAVHNQQDREATIRTEQRRRRADVDRFYFDEIDITPGSERFGGFRFNLPKKNQNLKIGVAIDGEIYSFDLRYVRIR
jgi:hypothetical protein